MTTPSESHSSPTQQRATSPGGATGFASRQTGTAQNLIRNFCIIAHIDQRLRFAPSYKEPLRGSLLRRVKTVIFARAIFRRRK